LTRESTRRRAARARTRECRSPTETFAQKLLADMLRIRRMEEKCAELYGAQKIRGFLHLYIGEEAVAVGAHAALAPDDNMVATYREHGHALVRGVPMDARSWPRCTASRRAARAGAAARCTCSTRDRFYGGNAIVGGGLPLATGLALADRMQGRRRVTACFFGEGAVAEGEFHESMNLAALWRLPVLFCCENNLYAMGTALARSEVADRPVRQGGALRHAAPASTAWTWSRCTRRARAWPRCATAAAPCSSSCRTYRFRAHSMFDPELYRDKAEVEALEDARPDPHLHGAAEGAGTADRDAFLAIDAGRWPRSTRRSPSPSAGTWEPVESLAPRPAGRAASEPPATP
jgi:pyruvate dehydrogenase E1 component alpha subunit